MNLAILFEFSTLNGGERSMLAVLQHLIAERMLDPTELHCVAPADGPLIARLQQLTSNVHPWTAPRGIQQRDDRVDQLISLQDRVGLELIHANSLAMGRLSGACALQSGQPATAHLRDIMRLRKNEVRLLAGNQRLIAVSDATREWHVQQGLDRSRLCVIRNGVDLSMFQPRPHSRAVRRDLGIPDDAFVILNVGQICLRKRQTDAAEAVVAACRQIPQLHLLIVGERHSRKPESMEFEARIQRTFTAAGYPDRLHALGIRNDVCRLMNEADVLLHMADQEPLGRVLIEAAASGLPIVATDVGGTREIVRNGESALLISPRDPAGAAEALVRIHRDPDLRTSLSAGARADVRQQFTIRSSAAAIFREWTNVVTAEN